MVINTSEEKKCDDYLFLSHFITLREYRVFHHFTFLIIQ